MQNRTRKDDGLVSESHVHVGLAAPVRKRVGAWPGALDNGGSTLNPGPSQLMRYRALLLEAKSKRGREVAGIDLRIFTHAVNIHGAPMCGSSTRHWVQGSIRWSQSSSSNHCHVLRNPMCRLVLQIPSHFILRDLGGGCHH